MVSMKGEIRMSEEVYQKYKEPYVFEAVKLYGVKAISKIMKHLETSGIYSPGERITEKDLRRNRAELERLLDKVVSTGPEVIPESGIKPSGDDTRSDTIVQMVQELQDRVNRLESLITSPVARVYKGEPHALTIRVPEELRQELEALKVATGESINSLVSKAISLMVSNQSK